MLENHINIHVIGTVSAGKSTFINTLFANYITPVSLKKCTMNPQSYKEPLPQINEIEQKEEIDNIYNNNIKTNKKLYENGIDEIIPNIYDVNLFNNLFDNDREFRINITDFPGINDSTTKNKYSDYITKNSLDIDIIIMIIDITSGLNTSDELDILDMIQTHIIKKNADNLINTKLIILINKCDDLMNNNLNNTEHEALLEQINKVIQEKKINCNIIPISCKNILINMLLLENFEKLNNLDINYVGSSYFGNIYWNKLTNEQKIERLQDYVKNNKEEIFNNIDNNGFNNFKKVINSVINDNLIDLKKNQEFRLLLPKIILFCSDCQGLLLKIINYEENKNEDLEKYIIDYNFPLFQPLEKYFSETIWNLIKDNPNENGSTLFLKNLELIFNTFRQQIENIKDCVKPLLFLIIEKIGKVFTILNIKDINHIKNIYDYCPSNNYIESYYNYIKILLNDNKGIIYDKIKYFKYIKIHYKMIDMTCFYDNYIRQVILWSKNFKLLLKNNFDFIDNLFECLTLSNDCHSSIYVLYWIYHIYYQCICDDSIRISDLSYKKIYLLNELYNKKLDYKINTQKNILQYDVRCNFLRKIKYIINILFTLKSSELLDAKTCSYKTNLKNIAIIHNSYDDDDDQYFDILDYSASVYSEGDYKEEYIKNNLGKFPSLFELKMVDNFLIKNVNNIIKL